MDTPTIPTTNNTAAKATKPPHDNPFANQLTKAPASNEAATVTARDTEARKKKRFALLDAMAHWVKSRS